MQSLSFSSVISAIWNTAWPIVVAILLFAVVILIHEFGHFFFAKLFKVKVNEFALGFGPTLLKKKKGDTTYAWRLIPFGGFCAMEGEDGESEDENSFQKKKVWKRIIIVAAGAFNNIVLGLILVAIMLSVTGVFSTAKINGFYVRLGDVNRDGAITTEDAAIVQQYLDKEIEFDDFKMTFADADGNGKIEAADIEVINEAAKSPETSLPPSYNSGLRTGDEIKSIDGRAVYCASDLSYMMMASKDSVLEMTVERDGKEITFDAVNFNMSEIDGKNYVQSDFGVVNDEVTIKKPLTFCKYTFMEGLSIGRMVWMSLFDIISGRFGLNEISGPVGVVSAVSDTVSQAASSSEPLIGIESILFIIALITINLGLVNLFPLPALDGGRIVFLIYEGITRRRVSQKVEGWVHGIGFALLMGLILLITGNDIWRLISGD